MKNILITGGTGLVGKELTRILKDKNYHVAHLSRTENLKATTPKYKWDYKNNYIDKTALLWADTIIHLAGHSVADSRWSTSIKKEIYDSRILSTRLLLTKIKESGTEIKNFISASASGIYRTGKELQDENSPIASGFLADVVRDWEKETFKFEEEDIKTTAVRIGVVLAKNGGAFPQLIGPIKYGFGAPLGSGEQPTPWIHIEDLAKQFVYLLENKHSGIFNAVASVSTNKEMTKEFAKQLKKPLWMPKVPAFALKILLGEMSSVVLTGSNVSNKKIKETGFKFLYPDLQSATNNLLST